MKLSAITFVPASEFVSDKFQFLSNFPKPLYVRRTHDLTDAEYEDYRSRLSYPNGNNEVHVRINEACIIYCLNDVNYIVQGNSRKTTSIKMMAESNEDFDYIFDDVPIRFVQQELSDRDLIRLQFDGNDSTRKHKPIEIHRTIRNQYDEMIDAGMEVAIARKSLILQLGVTNQSISDALLLTDSAIDQELVEMIDDGLSADVAARIQRSFKELRDKQGHTYLTMSEILDDLRGMMKNRKKNKIVPSMVKEWREEFERKTPVLSSEQAMIKQMLDEDKDRPMQLTSKSERSQTVAETAPIDVEKENQRIKAGLTTATYDPSKMRLASGIVTKIATQADETSQNAIYNMLLSIIDQYGDKASPETIKDIASVMKELQ